MHFEYVPLLQMQRDLHDIPRGWDRFRAYLEAMQPGTDNTIAPLVVMNPMGKEHVATRLDELISLAAEDVAAAAVREAAQRLVDVEGRLKVGLVLADDVYGGWTNRYLSEAQMRFAYMTKSQKRSKFQSTVPNGWVVGLLWSSDQPSRDHVRAEVLAAIYRALYIQRYGLPTTLRQMLLQEGLASQFAGTPPPRWEEDERSYSQYVIQPFLDSTDFPTIFACLYGDEAAYAVGYPALGLSQRAGYSLGYDVVHRYLHDRMMNAATLLTATDDVPSKASKLFV